MYTNFARTHHLKQQNSNHHQKQQQQQCHYNNWNSICRDAHSLSEKEREGVRKVHIRKNETVVITKIESKQTIPVTKTHTRTPTSFNDIARIFKLAYQQASKRVSIAKDKRKINVEHTAIYIHVGMSDCNTEELIPSNSIHSSIDFFLFSSFFW